MAGERWRLGHRPGLDGLRGLAILFVFGVHLNPAWFPAWGSVGVGLFFVLSGFLITSLLLEEHERAGRIDLRAFYARRARRLFPALAALLVVSASLYYVLGWPLWKLAAVAFYVSNVVQGAGESLPLLDHTWSLAVEEQFYLAWPLVLMAALAVRGSRAVLWVAALGAVAALVARFAEWGGSPVVSASVRVSFHTNAAGLLIGCALAAWMTGRKVPERTRPLAATVALGCAGAVGIIAPALGWAILAAPVAYVAGALALWWLVRGTSAGWLDSRPMRFVGRRSYGYYLWHVPAIALAVHFSASIGWRLVALAVAVGLAELSWRFVEQPFLRPRASVVRAGSATGRRRPDRGGSDALVVVARV